VEEVVADAVETVARNAESEVVARAVCQHLPEGWREVVTTKRPVRLRMCLVALANVAGDASARREMGGQLQDILEAG
jgi:hypothetical protein